MLDTTTFFDESFYLSRYSDVAQAVAGGFISSGLAHFSQFGVLERRDPNALFDTSYYLLQNQDVAAAVDLNLVTAFDHFITYGQIEGRSSSALFNSRYYLLKNPDVAAAVGRDELTGLQHFVLFGQYEGRSPSALFDTPFYLQNNPDVAAVIAQNPTQLSGIEHFVAYGQVEGRDPGPFFDTSYYLGQNPDVAGAIANGFFKGAVDHFGKFGRQEGRAILEAFPVSSPTGPFSVGTVTFPLLDASRDEIFTPTIPDDKRELVVQIWYPAAVGAGATPAPYVNPVIGQAIAQALDIPSSVLNIIRPSAFLDVPVADTQTDYPVLLFSHGLAQWAPQNTFQVEELASHGYVVVGINHTYVAGITAFPDGRVIPINTDFLPQGVEDFESALNLTASVTAGDAIFVLNTLGELNSNDPSGLFTGRLDLTKVGMFGHSFGGITTTAVMGVDPRFKAGINMDGPILGAALGSLALNRPYMLMNASQPYRNTTIGQILSLFDQRLAVYNQATAASYNLTIAGTEHENFSDRSVLLPLGSIYAPETFATPGIDIGVSKVGSIEGDRVTDIINAYTLAFFDQHLKGENEPLLAGPSTFPEVQFASRNATLVPA